MELHKRLELANAPAELVGWVRDRRFDFEGASRRCQRAEHRIWLAACGEAPIQTLIEAAAAAVFLADGRVEGPPPLVSEVLHLAVAGGEPARLVELATACEQLALGEIGGYRKTSGPRLEALARAAALVARAAEALAEGTARREAVRLERARATGANLGIGMQSVLPRDDGPPRLVVLAAAHDPAQGSFHFSVAACAQAILDAGIALDGDADDAGAMARHLDAVVAEALDGWQAAAKILVK